MATDIEKLVVQMSAEFRDFNKQFAAANGVASKQFNAIQKKARETDKVLNSIGKNMSRNLTMPLTGIGAALGVRELIRMTDTWTDLNSRVRIAAGGLQEGTDVMGRLSDMARRTYSSLELTTESYLTNSQALKELGYSTTQQLDFTESLNNALVVSGAKGDKAATVLNALGKAMASGQLRGENLNTVIESGGRVAQALADGLGVTTNQLRKMGEAGTLTSSSVFKALTSQMEKLRKEADGMQATIGDAVQLLRNSFLEYVGGADQASGASAQVAQSILLVADNLDVVAAAALTAATAIIGALAGRAMFGAAATMISTAKALKDFIVIARTAQGLSGLATAFGALGAAANPIALIVGGAAALAVGHFANQAIEAKLRTERVNTELERMGLAGKAAAGGLDEAAAAQGRLNTAKGIAEVNQKVDDFTAQLGEAKGEFDGLTRGFEDLAGTSENMFGPATEGAAKSAQEVARATKAFRDQKISAADLKTALDAVATSMPNWADQINQIIAAAQAVERLTGGLSRFVAERSSIGKPDPQANIRTMREASYGSLTDYNEKRDAGQKWITEQERRNTLTREQRDLEDEILRIRKDLPNAGLFSAPQVETLAKANLKAKEDGKKGSKKADKDPFDASVRQRLADLQTETALRTTLNPLINDHGYAVEKLRVQLELENAATKAGLALDPDRRAAILKLSEDYAVATVNAEKLAEAQGATVRQMEDLRDASRQALDTIIDGFLEGKDAGEIFGNVLKDIGKQLISMGLDSLFGGGSGGGFGLLGQLFGIKAATGGQVRGPGSGTSDSIPARLSDGEFVVNAKAAGQNLDLLHAINSGKMPGFKDGGMVGMPAMPSIPRLAPANDSGGASFSFAPVVTMNDGSPESIARLERSMGKMQVEFEGRVKRIILGRGKRWVG